MRTITTVDELVAYVRRQYAAGVHVYIRYSRGAAADRKMGASTNHITGQREAGLSVNNFVPTHMEWMMREEAEAGRFRRHIARQLREYSFLPGQPYLLTGELVERGGDNEPLLINWRPLPVRLAPSALEQANRIRPSYVPNGGEWLYEGME